MIEERVENEFIVKVYEVIEDNCYGLRWNEGGTSFIVTDSQLLQKTVLHQYFKMHKFISFARKLTKYGFTRSKLSRTSYRFFHQYFSADKIQLNKIKMLRQQELLPKHLKLKKMRANYMNQVHQEKNLNQETTEKQEKQLKSEEQSFYLNILAKSSNNFPCSRNIFNLN